MTIASRLRPFAHCPDTSGLDSRVAAAGSTLYDGPVEEVYGAWAAPDLIVSDGAYGIGGFPGDPRSPAALAQWYGVHVAAWSTRARPSTTLWFWNTELGWATVHPLLVRAGWQYVQTIVWDKGLAHLAGNVNGRTIRRLPTVTEVCVFYRRRWCFPAAGGLVPARQWLRSEWQRAGLPLCRANQACGVRSAASRKYFTADWLWYPPPPAMMARLVAYANLHGAPAGRPYFSLDGRRPLTDSDWARLRHPWNHQHGLTNVWSHRPLHGAERCGGDGRSVAPRTYRRGPRAAAHLNQKPLALMRRIVLAASDVGDTIWEPFGGLCTASVAAVEAGRRAFAAEPDPYFASLARQRLAALTDARAG